MVFICYNKCSTCAKARKWLEEKHLKFRQRDIKEENPNINEIKSWHQQSGLPLKRFFNTSGIRYRELDLKNKLVTMTVEEQYAILATDGMLLKRPIVITDDEHVLVGFKLKDWQAVIE